MLELTYVFLGSEKSDFDNELKFDVASECQYP